MGKISRRSLLAGVGVAGLIKPASPAILPSVSKPRLLKLGSGIKIRGAILYQPSWFLQWAPFWYNFDWNNLIKPMIDAAAFISANCIKFNLDGVSPDGGYNYPADTILRAELNQVCEYAASLGMATYLQLGYSPVHSFAVDRSNLSAGSAAAAKIAGWADKIPSIVGIDCMNEWGTGITGAPWNGNTTQAVADMTFYMNAIRAMTTKPLTISSGYDNLIYQLIDFHDFHYYNTSGFGTFDPTVANPLRSASYYKGAFIMGETGMPLGTVGNFPAAAENSNTAIDQFNWMSAVPKVTNLPDCLGGCQWALIDSFPPTPGFWGTFPNPIAQNVTNPRPQMALPFRQWPGKL